MNRRTFITHGCACGSLILAGTAPSRTRAAEANPSKPNVFPSNGDQVMAVLNEIDQSGDAALIDAVFTRWGYHCFHERPQLKAFAERQRGNFQGYLDYINSGRGKAWEKLDYDPAAGVIRVTSRKSGYCVCAYAQCARPAKSLCTHCCAALQAEFFKTITGRPATVRIEESTLLGGERCRTTVQLGPAATTA